MCALSKSPIHLIDYLRSADKVTPLDRGLTIKGARHIRLGEDGEIHHDGWGHPGTKEPDGSGDLFTAPALSVPTSTARVEIQGRLRRAVKRGVLHPARLREMASGISRSLDSAGHGTGEIDAFLTWLDESLELPEGLHGPRDGYLPFWIPADIASWLAPEVEDFIPEDSTATAPGTPNVWDPDGNPYEIPSVFYIAPGGNDMDPGSIDLPFATFWPIRMWFALIEWLSFYRSGWDFSAYHPTIYLREGAWSFDDEYAFSERWTYETDFHREYGVSTDGDCPPPFESIYTALPLDITDRVNAYSLGRKYMQGGYAAGQLFTYRETTVGISTGVPVGWSEFYGGERRFLGYCFLKVPRGLTGVQIMAYHQEQASIRGCLTDYTDDGLYADTLNPQYSRIIGELTRHADCLIPDAHVDDLEGILFHENQDVQVQGISFEGFRTAIHFLGACQVAHVSYCEFMNLGSWGVKADLVEYHDCLRWDKEADEERACVAWWPVRFLDAPNDLCIHHNIFEHVGQNGDSSGINLGTSASNVEIHDNEFVECVDGVMVDTGPGSGLHIHHNRFFCGLESRNINGDGNGIDLKTIRPRTAESLEELEPEEGEELPPERWTRIHDNWFMGNLEALIMHKGVGWVQIYNNYFIDNRKGICISPKGVSVMAIDEIDPTELHTCTLTTEETSDEAWDLLVTEAGEDCRHHRFAWWDPMGIYESSDPHPYDDWEEDAEGRGFFTIEKVYIFRNVVAASWDHGIDISEGAVTLACEKRWGTEVADDGTSYTGYGVPGGSRAAYALTVRDVVVARNTIDSNGGILRKESDCACEYHAPGTTAVDIGPAGYGILLDRTTPDEEEGVDDSLTHAYLLGDRFERVAIYNNILSNNFLYQIFVMDSASHAGVFENIDNESLDYNLISRPLGDAEPEGINNYVGIAIDFNAYFYEGIGTGGSGSRSANVTHVEEDGEELEAERSFPNDVALTTFPSLDAFEYRTTEARSGYAVESAETSGELLFRTKLALDINRVEVDSYELLYDTGSWGSLLDPVRSFTFAAELRSSGEDLAEHYREWYLGDWQPWKTRNQARSLIWGAGASGSASFPDETLQVETGESIYLSPDIEGRTTGRGPDIGAYEYDES